MKDYSRSFYRSKKWKTTSRMYMTSRNYICERCGSPASICHHRHYITPNNIGDPTITLNPDNLECLCHACHNKEHSKIPLHNNGVSFDESGNLVKSTDVFIVCGAPGSGKSTYVSTHKGSNDIVFDLDRICAALRGSEDLYAYNEPILSVALDIRETVYRCIEERRGKWHNAWIITSTADKALQEAIAYRLKGEIITMPATFEECVEHIQGDPRRSNKLFHIQLVSKWFEEMERRKAK